MTHVTVCVMSVLGQCRTVEYDCSTGNPCINGTCVNVGGNATCMYSAAQVS